jgi:hypothetical protein
MKGANGADVGFHAIYAATAAFESNNGIDVYSVCNGCDMEVPDELKIAIELSERSIRAGGPVAVFAREVIRLLKAAEQRLLFENVHTEAKRPSGLKLVYVVDKAGMMLTEFRTSGKSNPFRCPKGLYDAMVTVLADADRPLGVEEIGAEVGKVTREPPADHQVRVALRFWLHVDPALVSRNRARYRSTNAASFREDAANLWTRLSNISG